jgi:uncharacterized protein
LAVFGFVGLIVVLVVLLHLYLWKRLVRDPLRPGWPRRVGGLVAILLTLLIPATLIGTRTGHVEWLAWPGYLWLALMFYLFVILLVLEVPRLAIALVMRRSRRNEAARTAPGAGGKPAAWSLPASDPDPTTQIAGSDPIAQPAAPGTTERAGPDAITQPAEPDPTARTTGSATAAQAAESDPSAHAAETNPSAQTGVPGTVAHAADPNTAAQTARSGAAAPTAADGSAPEAINGRRLLLARGVAIFAGLTAAGVTAYGVKTALGPPQINRVQIPLAKLPRAMDGTRLAVVSDIHLGPLAGSHHVGRIVELINSTNADIVCVVGDLVDGTVAELGRFARPLADIESRRGAYFVTGNHEYYSGFRPWVDEVARLGVRPLRNERLELGGLDLAGVNDLGGADFGDAPDFGKALGDRDAARPVVLMAHQPVVAHQAAKYGVDLQVSGHTHGGQMVPFNLLVRLQQPVVSGLGTVDGVPVFVTNGAGFWGPPVRVGAPPQVTVIDLRTP